MKIRLVKSLKGGEKLAEPVITQEKETLISKGTILKPEYLDLISFLGIDTVCIEDPYHAYENRHDVISGEKRKEYIERVQKILENHIYQGKESLEKIKPLADNMLEDLLAADENIVMDIVERDGNLYEHTIMVTILAVMIARKLKISEERIRSIAQGCLLHDLGLRYITVPYINCDMESKSASEVFEYKKHTILGYSALEEEEWLDTCSKKMVLFHHERIDGSGFPLRQKTKEIECSILQICDAFDCFISGMECKRLSIQEALEYLVESSDVRFENRIVQLLQRMVARYPAGTKVKLSTGEIGIVLSQSGDSIRPVIGVLDEEDELTEVRYYLEKNKEISILQVENK